MSFPPTPPSTNSSTSSRRRRAQASSSEEDPTGNFGISACKYRVGAPPLRHLPLVSGVNDACRDVERLLGPSLVNHATEVLRNYRITEPEGPPLYVEMEAPVGNLDLVFSIELVSRMYPQEPNDPRTTLLIVTKWTSNALETWPNIVSELKRYVNYRVSLIDELKDVEIDVEMVAPELVMDKYIAPIPNDANFAKIAADWPAIRTGVVKILGYYDSTKNYITAVALFSLGYKLSNNPRTVFISVSYDSNSTTWPPIVKQLQDFVDEYKYGLEIHMEHNQVTQFAFTLLPPEVPPKILEHNLIIGSEYSDKVNLGADISAGYYLERNDGKFRSPLIGTMGCFLEIKTVSLHEWTPVALTNYHVVRPAITGYQLLAGPRADGTENARISIEQTPRRGSDLIKADRKGIFPSDKNKRKVIENPARTKHNVTIDEFNKDPAQYNDETIKQQIAFFDANRQPFASAWFGSGYMRRTKTHGRLDWALLMPLQQNRVGENRLPSYEEWLQPYNTKTMPRPNARGAILKAPQGQSLASMDHGARIYKVGSSTKATIGYFNGLKADCAVIEDAYLHSDPSKRFSTEYTYIGEVSNGRPFATVGDSGAVVFDNEGRAQGLLFSGQRPQQGKTGYAFVTPIEDVFADIKALSDGQITDVRIAGTGEST